MMAMGLRIGTLSWQWNVFWWRLICIIIFICNEFYMSAMSIGWTIFLQRAIISWEGHMSASDILDNLIETSILDNLIETSILAYLGLFLFSKIEIGWYPVDTYLDSRLLLMVVVDGCCWWLLLMVVVVDG